MTKIINIIFLLTLITFINPDAIAKTKKDCSQYSTKTFSGLAQKMRCKKGLEPLKKNFFKSLSWKKDKSKSTYIPEKPCNEYSTKSMVGLAAKLRCIKNK